MKTILMYILIAVIFIVIAVGVWKMKRAWNYSWGYESQVQTEICGMVKPEHLTEKGKKICK